MRTISKQWLSRAIIVNLILMPLLIQGCNVDSNPIVPTAAPDMPLKMAREAIGNMTRVKSYHFQVLEGIPEFEVFPTEGDFVSPDRWRGTFENERGQTVQWIRVGPLYFSRAVNAGTNWQVNAGNATANAVFVQFDQLEPILNYVEDVYVNGKETVNDVETSHITVVYNIRALPEYADLSPDGRGRFDIWVGNSTRYIYKIGLSKWTTNTPTTYTFYAKINEPVTPPIERPR